jgi:hypothetical protein
MTYTKDIVKVRKPVTRVYVGEIIFECGDYIVIDIDGRERTIARVNIQEIHRNAA